MTINGTTAEPIEDGAYVDVLIKLEFVTILHGRYDICDLDVVQCPLTLDNEGVAITFDLTAPALPGYQTILLADLISIRLTICFSACHVQGQHSRVQCR